MTNRIDVRVEFSYQSKLYTPAVTLDLDALMSRSASLDGLHQLLAQENGIDTDSYLYEVMEVQELQFSNPSELAAVCLQGGQFDMACFARSWREEKIRRQLAAIAKGELGVEALDGQPQLERALFAAYRAGQAAGPDRGGGTG